MLALKDGLAQHRAHLVGNGDEQIAENLEIGSRFHRIGDPLSSDLTSIGFIGQEATSIKNVATVCHLDSPVRFSIR